MPVPASIDDLSTTPGSNSPGGSETPKDGDNYIRSQSAFIALLRDKLDGTSGGVTLDAPTINTPTIDAPDVTGGTFSAPTVSGTPVFTGSAATWSGNPTHSGNHTFSGVVSFSSAPSGLVTGGAYTPTPVEITNYSGPTCSAHTYLRIGSVVVVFGRVSGTVGSAGAAAARIPIPVASNFTSALQLTGTAQPGATNATNARLYADETNDGAIIEFVSASAGASVTFFYSFSYQVL